MRVILNLPTEVAIALKKVAQEEGVGVEIAASVAEVEWLVAQGYLEIPDVIDENTPTEGSA